MSARLTRTLCSCAALVGAATLWVGPSAQGRQASEIEVGRRLFVSACSSCHGDRGQGTDLAPGIANAGAAAADFQLRTGRMPMADPGAQAVRKPPAFADDEIGALVAYVASLGPGPEIPAVDPLAGDLGTGQELFVSNCAPCHGATGGGGAVGEGALAPSLLGSKPLDVAEAVVSGPGQMPVFGFTEHERNSIAAYVEDIQTRRDPGGADIGGVGPVPEGYVAWALGTVAVLLVCVFIGGRGGEASS
jgi:ubiquinol-cytochrome c reductase cytochrome c subunit